MTRRKTATRRAGRCGGRAVHAKLSASGGERCGRLWNREKQREPAIRCREQQSVAGPVRTTLGRSEPRRADDRRYSLRWPGADGGTGDRRKRGKTRFGSVARRHGEHHGSHRALGRPGGPWIGSAAAVSGGDRRIESVASRGGTSFRGASRSAALPDSQATECEGVSAGELPERLRPADAQRVCDEQLRGRQSSVGENLPTVGTD